MSNQTNPKTTTRRWSLIAAGAVVVTLLTAPLAGYAASAARDDGNFMMRTTDQSGFVGQAGMRLSEKPDSSTPVSSSVTQRIVLGSNYNASPARWRSVDYSLTVRTTDGASQTVTGKTSESGYFSDHIDLVRTVSTGGPRDALPMVAELTVGSDKLVFEIAAGFWDTPEEADGLSLIHISEPTRPY